MKLQTPKERISLLKAGVRASTIEKIYNTWNDIKPASVPILKEL